MGSNREENVELEHSIDRRVSEKRFDARALLVTPTFSHQPNVDTL